jgi:hypothetical protein
MCATMAATLAQPWTECDHISHPNPDSPQYWHIETCGTMCQGCSSAGCRAATAICCNQDNSLVAYVRVAAAVSARC